MTFSWAQPSDDSELRQLLRDIPIPGRLTLSFEREPSFFAATEIEGTPHATLLIRDEQGVLAGMASCAIRLRYINGQPMRVGYLSQLRHRSGVGGLAHGRLISKGYAQFRVWLAQQNVPFMLMSVISDNESALRLLTHPIAGFPKTKPVGTMHTYAINTRRQRSKIDPLVGHRLLHGNADLAGDILECMRRNHARYQFAPVWDRHTWPMSHPPKWEDVSVLMTDGRIIGALSLWDQCPFKQTVVRAYAKNLARWRGWVNLLGHIIDVPRLPNPGQALNFAFISQIAIDKDDPDAFAALLRAACNRAAQRAYDYIVLGLCEGHPLQSVVQHYRHIDYVSNIYALCWDEGLPAVAQLDARRMDPEIAVL